MNDVLRKNSGHLNRNVLWVSLSITTFHVLTHNAAYITIKRPLS